MSKDLKSLLDAAGLWPPPHYLRGNSLDKILKPLPKSSTGKLFFFTTSSYLHFSKTMTKHPKQTLFLVISEERDLSSTQIHGTKKQDPGHPTLLVGSDEFTLAQGNAPSTAHS